MKKVLLATTALALSAGVASAEMKLGGSGYVGMTGTTDDMAYDSRFQLQFDGSAETDSGLTVNARARIRIGEAGVGIDDTDDFAAISQPRFDIAYDAISLSLGNTADAIDANTNAYASCVGNVGDFCGDSFAGNGFDSNGDDDTADRVRINYTAGDFTLAASGQVDGGEDIAVSVSGKMGAVGMSVGYKVADIDDAAYAVDVNGSFGTVNAGLRYDQAAGADAIATLYGNTTFGATTVSAFVNNNDAVDGDDIYAWGVGASYDLGGGIALGGAIAEGSEAQAHMSFSF